MIENVSPATVISDPAMTDRTVRAAGPSPLNTNCTPSRSICPSTSVSTMPRTVNATTIRPGTKPRLWERSSQRLRSRFTVRSSSHPGPPPGQWQIARPESVNGAARAARKCHP